MSLLSKKLSTLAIAVGLSVTAGAALAAPFTVGGTDYDVTLITGTFAVNQIALENQIWWGDSTLAIDFATVVADSFGLPSGGGDFGPIFAFLDASPTSVSGALWNGGTSVTNTLGVVKDFNQTWAVAEFAKAVPTVPLPAGAPLLAFGLGGLALMRSRRKS